MAKKAKSRAAGANERKLAATVRKSAQEIWYAGLGVFATTRDEGGKVYQALVKEGKRVEATARKLAKSRFTKVRGQLTKVTTEATRRATHTWTALERNLARQVNTLQAEIDRIRGAKKKKPAKRAAKKRSPARRKSARKHA